MTATVDKAVNGRLSRKIHLLPDVNYHVGEYRIIFAHHDSESIELKAAPVIGPIPFEIATTAPLQRC